MGNLTALTEEHRRKIENLHEVIPNLAFGIAEEVAHIEKSKGWLDDIAYMANIHGRVDTKAASKLLRWPELIEINSEDTYITGGHRAGYDKVKLSFSVRQADKRVVISKVIAFKHWTNLFDKPRLIKFNGPSHIIHNHAANCTRGIDEPTDRLVTVTFTEKNYHDPELTNWVDADEADVEPVQVFKTDEFAFIYCLYEDIKINNRTMPCPPFTFRIPLSIGWKVKNFRHVASTLSFTSMTGSTATQPS